jgi:hypothetical protein
MSSLPPPPLPPTHLVVLLHGVAGNGGHLSGAPRARMRVRALQRSLRFVLTQSALTHAPPQ